MTLILFEGQTNKNKLRHNHVIFMICTLIDSSRPISARESAQLLQNSWLITPLREAETSQSLLIIQYILSTVIHTNKYSAKRKYESERHFSNTTHIAIICALEFSCKFDTEPFKQKRKTNTKRKFAEPQIDSKFFEFSVLRFSYYIGTRQSNPLTISYRQERDELKAMSHETIRNNDFQRNTALQHCCDTLF